MKRTFIILFFLGLISFCYSQDDENAGAYEKIKNYRDSVAMHLERNEPDKITVKRYFELEDEDTASLVLNEEEILLIITGQYALLLNDVLVKNTALDPVYYIRVYNRKDDRAKLIYANTANYVNYYSDALAETIVKYIRKNKINIRDNIVKTISDPERSDFILLLFNYYLVISDLCDVATEQEMLSGARDFLENYPGSEYSLFVKEYIDVEFEKGNWGFGAYIDGGTFIYLGETGKTLKNPFMFLASLEIDYKKFSLNLGIGGSTLTNIKQDFFADTLWKAGHEYSVSPLGTLTLGYRAFENEKIRITPSLGANIIALRGNVGGDSLYYNGINILSKNPMVLSIAFDYKFLRGKCKSDQINRRGSHYQRIFADLRFKISYMHPQLSKYSEKLKGGILFATLGVGFNTYSPKIVKNKDK
jgi:hypothetical protein